MLHGTSYEMHIHRSHRLRRHRARARALAVVHAKAVLALPVAVVARGRAAGLILSAGSTVHIGEHPAAGAGALAPAGLRSP